MTQSNLPPLFTRRRSAGYWAILTNTNHYIQEIICFWAIDTQFNSDLWIRGGCGVNQWQEKRLLPIWSDFKRSTVLMLDIGMLDIGMLLTNENDLARVASSLSPSPLPTATKVASVAITADWPFGKWMIGQWKTSVWMIIDQPMKGQHFNCHHSNVWYYIWTTILYTRSLRASVPQLLVGGPSGRLDFVLRALRALRPCDPRNDVVSVSARSLWRQRTMRYFSTDQPTNEGTRRF